MFKVNNKDTRTTPSIVNFEHVIADWVASKSLRHPFHLFPFAITPCTYRFFIFDLHKTFRKPLVQTNFKQQRKPDEVISHYPNLSTNFFITKCIYHVNSCLTVVSCLSICVILFSCSKIGFLFGLVPNIITHLK